MGETDVPAKSTEDIREPQQPADSEAENASFHENGKGIETKVEPTEPETESVAQDPSSTEILAEPAEDHTGDETTREAEAQIDRNVVRNNRKFDPSVRDVTDDPEAIRKQVEFYFGDWNFPQDKFMWESCEGTANKPMPITKIHSFMRMRNFQPYSAVVASLRDSRFLDVTGEEGKELIKRKVAYKPVAQARAKIEAATVYVKGFGDENPDTQFDLESFFTQFSEIKGLKLRRTNEGLFKGSVFVTFPDEDSAKAFIEKDPPPTYKGNELKIMSKRDYCVEKMELIRQGKLEPNKSSQRKFFEGRESGNKRGFGDRHRLQGREADDWKKRRDTNSKPSVEGRRGRGRGRGGRGRRGGRGGGQDRESRKENGEPCETFDSVKPQIQSAVEESDKVSTAIANGKRARDTDGPDMGAPPLKKVDNKQEATTAAS